MDTLKINTLKDLIEFRDSVNGGTTYEGLTVTLTADIDMKDIKNWDAIGTNSSTPFKGTFEGKNHKINSLKIDKGSESFQGLFGFAIKATIQNLGVKNVNVIGRDFVGGLVGNGGGLTITNCYVTGQVTGAECVGGLVGDGHNKTVITDCCVIGNVKGTTQVGGLVGFSGDGITIENSYVKGSVTGEGYVGGLEGWNENVTIKNSYVEAKVTGNECTKWLTGTLVGYSSFGEIINCYAEEDVKDDGYVVELVGRNIETTINNCYDKETLKKELLNIKRGGKNEKIN